MCAQQLLTFVAQAVHRCTWPLLIAAINAAVRCHACTYPQLHSRCLVFRTCGQNSVRTAPRKRDSTEIHMTPTAMLLVAVCSLLTSGCSAP